MMEDILTAVSIVLTEGELDVVEVLSPGATDEQAATLAAVLKNERLLAILDKWFALDASPDHMAALLFCHRGAKAILDEFWATYDEERTLGNIPEASPWWD